MRDSAQRWSFAFRNLIRHARRNLISGAAIAFGFTGLALMGAYLVRTDAYLGVVSVYLNQAGHVSIYKKDGLQKFLTYPGKYTLSPQDQLRLGHLLREFPEVEFTAGFLIGQGLLSTGCRDVPFLAKGIDDKKGLRIREHSLVKKWTPGLIAPPYDKSLGIYPNIGDGISITGQISQMIGKPKIWDEAPKAVSPVVTDCTDKAAKAKLSETSDVQMVAKAFNGDFSAADAFIVAHHSTGLAFSEETSIFTNLSHLQKLFQTQDITYLAVFLKPGTSTSAFYDRLKQKLDAEVGGYDVYPFYNEKISPFYAGVMEFLTTMASFFFVLVLTTIIITIVSFLTVGFMERRREMGTLRSIGYTPRMIAGDFFRESTLLIVLSAMSGTFVCYVVVVIVNSLKIQFSPPGIANTMPFMLTLTPLLCLSVAALVAGIGLSSAWLKLRKLTQEPIVDLLRG